MAITFSLNTAFPKFNVSNPAFVRGFQLVIAHPSQEDGVGYTYYQPQSSMTDSATVGRAFDLASNYAIVITDRTQPSFPAEDVRRWHPDLKAAIARYVDLGAVLAFDNGVAMTGDDIREYEVP